MLALVGAHAALLAMLPGGAAAGAAAEDPPGFEVDGPGNTCYGCLNWCGNVDTCTPPAAAKWHDVAADIGVHGRGWPAQSMGGRPYARFPAHAEAIPGVEKGPEAVWSTAQRSAGINTRFRNGCGRSLGELVDSRQPAWRLALAICRALRHRHLRGG